MKQWKIFSIALAVAVALSVGPVGWANMCGAMMRWAVTEGWVHSENAYRLGLPLVVFPFFLGGTMFMAWLRIKYRTENGS